MQTIRAIIGKGFGDEGKGLATDYFCSRSENALVIKHNGGAQAGHTVETDGKRFVFHQLSAGSFRNADTYLADSYYPDLYKLGEEISEFENVGGVCPKVYCHPQTSVTIIDDILINMISETLRGDDRHGSCGMGINECDLRTKAGFGITVKDLLKCEASEIAKKIFDIKDSYEIKRLSELGITGSSRMVPEAADMMDALTSKDVVINSVDEMMRNAEKYVTLCDDTGAFLRSRESIVFETGQGLLLDCDNEEYAPHVTASRTGLNHPVRILSQYDLKLTEAVYVTRSYVTRHGAGKLPYECAKEDLGFLQTDETNIYNPWQGSIRYAKHGGCEEFVKPVLEDLRECGTDDLKTSLFITHLNETDGKIKMITGDMSVEQFMAEEIIGDVFKSFYLSYSRYSKDIH